MPSDAPYRLPDVVKTAECADLYDYLAARGGHAVTIDASDVTRLSGLALQLLVVARRIWVGKGVDFDLHNPSRDMLATLALAGFEGEFDTGTADT